MFSASRAACSPRLPRVLSSLVCFSPPRKRTRIVPRSRYLVKHVLTYESDHFNLGFNINLILLAQLRIDNKHRYRQSINVNQVNLTISMSLHDKKLLRDQKFLQLDSLFTSYYHYYLLSFFLAHKMEKPSISKWLPHPYCTHRVFPHRGSRYCMSRQKQGFSGEKFQR